MYGMVNRAVEEMVCGQYGDATWEQIKRAAGVEVEVFISNEGYPDELTYRLVAAAAQVLDLPSDQVLEAFGMHWVLHTAQDGYGSLMRAGGSTLPEFLHNLPGFHARVMLIFPNLRPPRFQLSQVTDHSLHLHYHSHRPGLQPFVRGLLQGLSILFGAAAQVTVVQSREQGGDHDEFLLTWENQPPITP
jgi:hypothetical protein